MFLIGFSGFKAWSVNQKSVVQDHEIIIHHAKLVSLFRTKHIVLEKFTKNGKKKKEKKKENHFYTPVSFYQIFLPRINVRHKVDRHEFQCKLAPNVDMAGFVFQRGKHEAHLQLHKDIFFFKTSFFY